MGASYNPGGDVVGPASATANAVVRYSGTTGKSVKDSAVIVNDVGQVGIGTATPAGMLSILATSATTIGQTIRLASGQTADAFQVRDNAANVLSEFDASGNLAIGTATASAMVHTVARTASSIPLIAQATASQTGNLTEWRTSAGTAGLAVDSSLRIAMTRPADGSYGSMQTIGGQVFVSMLASASANTDSLFIGRLAGSSAATSAATNNLAVGSGALRNLTSGIGNTAIGADCGGNITTGTYNICLGSRAGRSPINGFGNICIGWETDVPSGSSYSFVIGYSIAATAGNQFVVGGAGSGFINDIYFGRGVVSSVASKGNVVINASGGSGTDSTGMGLDVQPGRGTGAGTGGSLRLRVPVTSTTGSTLQSVATVIECGPSSTLGFYAATPIARPSTAVAAATVVANTGTALNDASTFDGYTLAQVVKALRNLGLLG